MYIIEKFEHQIFISFSTVYVDKQGKQNCKWIDPSLLLIVVFLLQFAFRIPAVNRCGYRQFSSAVALLVGC
jgi:hypothetical protein